MTIVRRAKTRKPQIRMRKMIMAGSNRDWVWSRVLDMGMRTVCASVLVVMCLPGSSAFHLQPSMMSSLGGGLGDIRQTPLPVSMTSGIQLPQYMMSTSTTSAYANGSPVSAPPLSSGVLTGGCDQSDYESEVSGTNLQAIAGSTKSCSTDTVGSMKLQPFDATYTGQPLRDTMQKRRHVSYEVAQILYEDMVRGRVLEDMTAQMYYRGRVNGFVHLYNGQEAVSTGVVRALRDTDYVVSTYRDHVHAVSKGVPVKSVMAELYGKETGCSKGRGGSMHLFSNKHKFVGGFAFIGEQIPVALGLAYSAAFKRHSKPIRQQLDPIPAFSERQSNEHLSVKEDIDGVTVCFMGDGATNMGQFYEAMNMAALSKLPIIFVVENNNWAIGMASFRSTSVPESFRKAEAFGIPGIEVDGMDVLAVRAAAVDAVKRARSGQGPTVIEALTYRFRGHSLADPDELRSMNERNAWTQRDPINSFGKYMIDRGYATSATLDLVKRQVRDEVQEAVKFAEASPEPPKVDIGKYIFSDHYIPQTETLTPVQLTSYKAALLEELALTKRRAAGDKTPPLPTQLNISPNVVID